MNEIVEFGTRMYLDCEGHGWPRATYLLVNEQIEFLYNAVSAASGT